MFKNLIKCFSIFFIVVTAVTVNAKEVDSFTQLLNDHKMIFNMPKDYIQTKVKNNEDVSYQYAIKNKKSKLEIRYAIFTLKKELKEYEEWKNSKNKNGVKLDPNKGYDIFTYAVVENIAGSERYNEKVYDKKIIKNDFNADWGATYYVECNSEFGTGYKNALIMALHKDNEADVYIVFLFDDFKEVQNDIQKSFYSLRFASDYFTKRSILYSAAGAVSIITKTKVTPQEIEAKINFKDSDNISIDDYLAKISKAYSLKLNKLNFSDIQKVVNLANDENLIIIIYGNKVISHSALMFGYKVDSGNLIFRVSDSSYKDEDSINAATIESSIWNLKVDRAYYFSK